MADLGQIHPEHAPRRKKIDCLPDGIARGRKQQQSRGESETVVHEMVSQSSVRT